MDTTARLGLLKPNPDPVTGDDVDITDLNLNADKIDAAISFTVVTSSTRPATPFQGQAIIETDTGRAYIRVGTSWSPLLIPNAAGTHVFISGAELNVTRAAATDTVLYGAATADTVGRFLMKADGSMEWGPGNAGRDTNLYRGSVGNLLRTDDSFLATGFVTGNAAESIRVANSANVTTTETVIQSLTFNAVAGQKYMVQVVQNVQSTVAGDLVYVRVRWAAGASVSASSQRAVTNLMNCAVASRGVPCPLNTLIVPGVTGQVTVGVTLQRYSGTGTISSSGNSDFQENTIYVVGA